MELYEKQQSRPVWVSFENPTGEVSKGGLENHEAKGHAFEPFYKDEEKVLCDLNGQGVLRRIWMTVGDRSEEALAGIILRIWYDNAKTPAVEAPAGGFFCFGHNRMQPLDTALFCSPEGRSFLCTVPMPFYKHIRITVKNETGKDISHIFYDVNLTKEMLSAETLYFHVKHTVSKGLPLGEDVPLLPQVIGAGRFIGSNVNVTVNPVYGATWFGEGEVKIYLEGERTPTLVGTGTEDYIGTAWEQGTFQTKHQGCTVKDPDKVAFYRFHLPDPVCFDTGCKAVIQNIGGANKKDVLRLKQKGAPLIPVSYDVGGKFTPIYQKNVRLEDCPDESWVNFYRQDTFEVTAYYYLDRAEG